jgi:hypothetical protein
MLSLRTNELNQLRLESERGGLLPSLANKMKTMKLLAWIIALLITTSLTLSAADAAAAKAKGKKLYHVVAFKFKDTAAKDDIKKVEDAFRALPKKIKEIQSLEWGTNVSKEQRDKGFTHCFVLAFRSEEDCSTYIEHPEHKGFVGIVGPVLADVFVIDFWAQK